MLRAKSASRYLLLLCAVSPLACGGDLAEPARSGIDGGSDAATAPDSALADASRDAGVDAPYDAGVDTSLDAAMDATADAVDSSADVACATVCQPGDSTCSGAGISTCTAGDAGCAEWQPPVACGPHQGCVVSGSSASCACLASACSQAGSVCVGTATLDTCAVDGNGCTFVASSMTCPGTVHGTATCTAGACGLACDPGYGGSGCTIAPPRPIAPLSSATTTSQKPTLRWALANGTDGAQVDICRDPACSMIAATFAARSSSGAVPASLAAGVYFWRARGMIGSSVGVDTSPVWEFVVGARSAPTDTSWGTTLDVNRDGYADVLVGGTGFVRLYFGGPSGPSLTPATTLSAPANPNPCCNGFGAPVASAGDVNGDGYVDAIVGWLGYDDDAGRAYVYLGGPQGLSTTGTPLDSPAGAGWTLYGGAVAAIGDANGDGYGDVIVGATGTADRTTSAWGVGIHLGSPSGPSSVPSATFPCRSPANAVGGAGDLNGDGLEDFMFTTEQTALLFVATPGAIPTQPNLRLSNPNPQTFYGEMATGAGDMNGDGYADVVVTAPAGIGGNNLPGYAYVYLSASGWLSSTPNAIGGIANGDGFGGSISGGGDLDADGFADLVVGAPFSGNAYVFRGGASFTSSPSVVFTGASGPQQHFAASVASGGDVDGDGFADSLVGTWVANFSGDVDWFRGAAGGPSTTPSAVLSGAGYQVSTGAP